MAEIKEDLWFKQDYTPVDPIEEETEENASDDEASSIHEVI